MRLVPETDGYGAVGPVMSAQLEDCLGLMEVPGVERLDEGVHALFHTVRLVPVAQVAAHGPASDGATVEEVVRRGVIVGVGLLQGAPVVIDIGGPKCLAGDLPQLLPADDGIAFPAEAAAAAFPGVDAVAAHDVAVQPVGAATAVQAHLVGRAAPEGLAVGVVMQGMVLELAAAVEAALKQHGGVLEVMPRQGCHVHARHPPDVVLGQLLYQPDQALHGLDGGAIVERDVHVAGFPVSVGRRGRQRRLGTGQHGPRRPERFQGCPHGPERGGFPFCLESVRQQRQGVRRVKPAQELRGQPPHGRVLVPERFVQLLHPEAVAERGDGEGQVQPQVEVVPRPGKPRVGGLQVRQHASVAQLARGLGCHVEHTVVVEAGDVARFRIDFAWHQEMLGEQPGGVGRAELAQARHDQALLLPPRARSDRLAEDGPDVLAAVQQQQVQCLHPDEAARAVPLVLRKLDHLLGVRRIAHDAQGADREHTGAVLAEGLAFPRDPQQLGRGLLQVHQDHALGGHLEHGLLLRTFQDVQHGRSARVAAHAMQRQCGRHAIEVFHLPQSRALLGCAAPPGTSPPAPGPFLTGLRRRERQGPLEDRYSPRVAQFLQHGDRSASYPRGLVLHCRDHGVERRVVVSENKLSDGGLTHGHVIILQRGAEGGNMRGVALQPEPVEAGHFRRPVLECKGADRVIGPEGQPLWRHP